MVIYSYLMENEFAKWLMTEMEKRGISQAELARRSNTTQGTISRIVSGERNIGFDVCVAISRALHIAPENVLRAAVLLPPASENIAEKEDLLHLFDQMSKEKKKDLLNYAQFLLAKKD